MLRVFILALSNCIFSAPLELFIENFGPEIPVTYETNPIINILNVAATSDLQTAAE